ncbi:MAG: MFS transporter [Candidatus Bathyarchaeia archaeon]
MEKTSSVIWAITALFLGYFSFAMFRLSLGAAIPSIILEMNIDEFRAGLLYSIPLWSTAALLTPAGWLADQFGRKKILLVGYLLLAIRVLSFSYSPNYLFSVISLLISGVGSGMIVPSYYSLMGVRWIIPCRRFCSPS